MAVNATKLINFGTDNLKAGDIVYSYSPLKTPDFLRLFPEIEPPEVYGDYAYAISEYPEIDALLRTPLRAYSIRGTYTYGVGASFPVTEMAFGNGIFVAISSLANATISTSYNGINWTLRPIWQGGPVAGATSGTFNGIYFAKGVFVITATGANATGNGTQVFTSTDGIHWTYTVISSTGLLTQWPIYGVAGWLLLTNGTNWYRSTDNAVTWTSYQPTTAGVGKGRAYLNGVYVTGGFATSAAGIAYSVNNGLTWAAASTPVGQFGSIAASPAIFVAIDTSGTAGTIAASSYNGSSWTARTLPASAAWRCVAYGNGVFVALSSTGTIGATSADGTTWTLQNIGYSGIVWGAICAGGPPNDTFFVGRAPTNLINIDYSGYSLSSYIKMPIAPPINGAIPYMKAGVYVPPTGG
ncbi:hypothetical protein UFOVP36_40 [uncultured Caudovirales phage]|uniref:Uncharacterized protein n=1 Tax=uncultured Caudovirales phage TaxID=2100421 RepID=A0A6J5KJR0_9CAUD|nr:hypothetical protein UFOVP36_40 [uncultured Caudovirales phage]